MSNGSIVDVSTGAAQAIGRYFSVISVVPSSFYVVFVYLLVASDSWQHSPNWSHAFISLGHVGVAGIALLGLFSIGLGVLIHPIQFTLVQFFEGYWGTGSIAQSIRFQRILRYQNLCRKLNGERNCVNDRLVAWKAGNVETTLSIRAPLRSRYDEALRARNNFPKDLDELMPTRLGNILRRAESLAGSQYGMNALQVVPHLLLIAPAGHADYVNDQRSQLDLAVRMTFMSIAASATAILFLWPDGLWALIAIIPYVLAYLSYRGSVVAGRHYGAALDALVNLDRFTLYEQMHLKLPAGLMDERNTNKKLANLFDHVPETVTYEHPSPGTGNYTAK